MKPMLFGNITNIEPINIDASCNIYHIHHYSSNDIYAITFAQLREVMEVEYGDDMPGMTLEEFNSYVDSLIEKMG